MFCMGSGRKIKYFFDDIWQNVCNHKWKTLICVITAVVGFVLGIVFFKVFSYSWWYYNRCDYASKLFVGSFSLFFSFLLWFAVYYLCMLICCMLPRMCFASYIILAIACLYCGANTAATVSSWSVWGILFALLVTAVEVAGYILACLSVNCLPKICRNFKEAFCDAKQCLCILGVAFVAKTVMFFLILHVITAII